ncbi:putative alanine racemase-domain-containing protein [Phycomyces nitens]|nr:putative alanine racemase-domain-containing protein [Phycomyces nitens]
MVQDTGLGQEMFVTAYNKHDHKTGTKKTLCYRYTDDSMDLEQDGCSFDEIPNEFLSERTNVYCVSPPGETPWAKTAHGGLDLSHAISQLNIQDGSKEPLNGPSKKYPLPGHKHVSALVKFYDSGESLRVGQLIEVIGILGHPVSTDGTPEDFETHMATLTNTPVLHAITYRSLENESHGLFEPESLVNASGQARDIRAKLVDYISTAFGGDKLVAEYVLLQLLSRVTVKNRGVKLGQFSLNISQFPTSEPGLQNEKSLEMKLENLASKHVASVLSNLTQRFVEMPLSLEILNKSSFNPRSVDEQLNAGVLQLPNGTLLLVDETVLSEGTLDDTGVRNIQALMNIIHSQSLNYMFPYSQFEFDTDLGVISLSSTKSMLPNHCTVPLQASLDINSDLKDRMTCSKETLDIFRAYIESAKHAEYEIPDDVSEYIQEEFVNERKRAAENGVSLPSQEDLMARMSISRLLSLSFGESRLTKDTFDYAVRLDGQRMGRCAGHEISGK